MDVKAARSLRRSLYRGEVTDARSSSILVAGRTVNRGIYSPGSHDVRFVAADSPVKRGNTVGLVSGSTAALRIGSADERFVPTTSWAVPR
jgi:hypothetical protein